MKLHVVLWCYFFNENYESGESGVHGHFCGVIIFNEHQLPELKSKVFLNK